MCKKLKSKQSKKCVRFIGTPLLKTLIKPQHEISLKIQTLNTKGLTFGSLFKLNMACCSPILAIIFILVGVVNIFIPASIIPTSEGIAMTGFPAIAMLIVSYPILVLWFSLNAAVFMKVGQSIYTKFKPLKLSFSSWEK